MLVPHRAQRPGAVPCVAADRAVEAVEHRTHADAALVPCAESAVPPAEPARLARRQLGDRRRAADRVDPRFREHLSHARDPVAAYERVSVDARDDIAARGVESCRAREGDAGARLRDDANAIEGRGHHRCAVGAGVVDNDDLVGLRSLCGQCSQAPGDDRFLVVRGDHHGHRRQSVRPCREIVVHGLSPHVRRPDGNHTRGRSRNTRSIGWLSAPSRSCCPHHPDAECTKRGALHPERPSFGEVVTQPWAR